MMADQPIDRRNVRETVAADVARIEQTKAPLQLESGSFFRRKLAEMLGRPTNDC